MAFLVLDKEIIGSSLWVDPNMVVLFLTALLLARLRDYPAPMPQLRVDALEETGFIVPPGKYGFVPRSGSGLISDARLSKKRGMMALRNLGEPDLDSRSQEYGGRRLVRVNHGYLVLNFDRWQAKDHSAAERQRRYRERNRPENIPHQAQAEAVLAACSISDKRMIPIVASAIETHAKGQDWTADKTATRMIEGYRAYSAAAQELRFTVSARKFFAQGWWLDSKLWPFKQNRRQL